MALSMNAPDRKGTYLVLKSFRFRGRNFEEGMEFNVRRLDPSKGRLDALYRDGHLGLPDEDEDEMHRMERQEAIDTWQPPQSSKEEESIEPLPSDGDDFEE